MHLTELPLELAALTTQVQEKPRVASLQNKSVNHWDKLGMLLFAVNRATCARSYSGREIAKQIHRRLDVDCTLMGNNFMPQNFPTIL